MTNSNDFSTEKNRDAKKHLPAHEPNGYESSSTSTASSADLDGYALANEGSPLKSKKVKNDTVNDSLAPTGNSSSSNAPTIQEPQDSDVLCGRGRGYFYHPGNRRMLEIVQRTKARYRAATKSLKGRIVREIFEGMELNGSRFLKECDNGWYEVSDSEKHKKVCHCLREDKSRSESASNDSQAPSATSTIEIQRDEDKRNSAPVSKPQNPAANGSINGPGEMRGELDILGIAAAIQQRKDAAGCASSSKEFGQASKALPSTYLCPPGAPEGLELELNGTRLPGRLSYSRHPTDLMASQQANTLGLVSYDHFTLGQIGTHHLGLTQSMGMVLGDPGSADVLFGSDPSFYFHKGNIRLRSLIQSSAGFPPSTSEKKLLLTRGIVAELKLAGGRFLTRQRLGPPVVWQQIKDSETEMLIFGCLEEEEEAKYHAVLLQTQGPQGLDGNLVHRSQGSIPIVDIAGATTSSSEPTTIPLRSENGSRHESMEFDQEADEDEGETSISDNGGKLSLPRPNDVICGRGRGNFRHPGNRRLLRLFWDLKAKYKEANKSDKTVIGRMILQDVESRGGKFLKRTDDGWSEVDHQVALRKVCHGIRDIPNDPEKRKRSIIAAEFNETGGSEKLLPNTASCIRRGKCTGASTIHIHNSLESPSHISYPHVIGDCDDDDDKEDNHSILRLGKERLDPKSSPKKKKQVKREEDEAVDMGLILPRPTPPGTIVKDPTLNDVLCGRGRGHFGHPGNRRMLRIIDENTGRYKIGTKAEKGQVARDILFEVQSNGARFLKRNVEESSIWEVCTFRDALQKVCHGIRDAISFKGRKTSKDKTVGASASINEGAQIQHAQPTVGFEIESVAELKASASLL